MTIELYPRQSALVPQLVRRGTLPAARMTQLVGQPTGVFGVVKSGAGRALVKLSHRFLIAGHLAVRAFHAAVVLRPPIEPALRKTYGQRPSSAQPLPGWLNLIDLGRTAKSVPPFGYFNDSYQPRP